MDSNTNVRDFILEKNSIRRNKRYNEYVKEQTPRRSWVKDMLAAWLVGGMICVLGQAFSNLFENMGMDKETAGLFCTLCLVLLSVIFTVLGWYSKLANFAGAGTLVPITGFANSVAAPAQEYTVEGEVFGKGCKIFTIAGPVILYGVFASWCLGFIYWVLKWMGVV